MALLPHPYSVTSASWHNWTWIALVRKERFTGMIRFKKPDDGHAYRYKKAIRAGGHA